MTSSRFKNIIKLFKNRHDRIRRVKELYINDLKCLILITFEIVFLKNSSMYSSPEDNNIHKEKDKIGYQRGGLLSTWKKGIFS